MDAKLENGELVLRIPLNLTSPKDSMSGRTWLLASESSFSSLPIIVKDPNGRDKVLGLSPFYVTIKK